MIIHFRQKQEKNNVVMPAGAVTCSASISEGQPLLWLQYLSNLKSVKHSSTCNYSFTGKQVGTRSHWAEFNEGHLQVENLDGVELIKPGHIHLDEFKTIPSNDCGVSWLQRPGGTVELAVISVCIPHCWPSFLQCLVILRRPTCKFTHEQSKTKRLQWKTGAMAVYSEEKQVCVSSLGWRSPYSDV